MAFGETLGGLVRTTLLDFRGRKGGRRWTKVDEGGRRWTKVDEKLHKVSAGLHEWSGVDWARSSFRG